MDLQKRKTNANPTVMMIRIVEYQEAANDKSYSAASKTKKINKKETKNKFMPNKKITKSKAQITSVFVLDFSKF